MAKQVAKHVIGLAADIAPGGRKLAVVKGRPIIIFNVNGDYFGLMNRCPHQGASLCEGRLIGLVESDGPAQYTYSRRGEIIRCPWHGWEFDVKTGQSWFDPANTRIRTYDVHVESGAGLQEGLYKAETVPVRVEDNYIVVEM